MKANFIANSSQKQKTWCYSPKMNHSQLEVEDWDQSSPEAFRILGQPVGVPTIQGGQSGQGLGSSIVSMLREDEGHL